MTGLGASLLSELGASPFGYDPTRRPGRQMSVIRGQRAEGRGQRTEDRGQDAGFWILDAWTYPF